MRKRPFAISLFSFVMVMIAFSLPAQVIYLEGYESLFQMLSVLNIIIMLLSLATAAAAYNAHKSFHVLFPVTLLAVIVNNWWVGFVGLNYNFIQTTIASFSFLALCSVLLEKKAYNVLTDPKMRWWHVSRRSKIEIPVSFTSRSEDKSILKTSFDISETGLFLQGLESRELDKIQVGEVFDLCLYFDSRSNIKCNAKVVRKSPKNGLYPAGIGLQFETVDSSFKSTIKRLRRTDYTLQMAA